MFDHVIVSQELLPVRKAAGEGNLEAMLQLAAPGRSRGEDERHACAGSFKQTAQLLERLRRGQISVVASDQYLATIQHEMLQALPDCQPTVLRFE